MPHEQLLMEIQDLYARYNRAVDRHDIDAWLDTYSATAVFHGRVTLVGHEDIRSFALGERGRLHRRGYGRTQHRTANLLIEPVTEVEARGTCDLLIIMEPLDSRRPYEFLVASYRDTYVKQQGRWQFSERHVDWWPDRTPSPPRRDLLRRTYRRIRRSVRRAIGIRSRRVPRGGPAPGTRDDVPPCPEAKAR